MALRPYDQAFNISPTRVLVVKKEITEDLEQSKMISKVVKTMISLASKPQAKRELITRNNDFDKESFPPPVRTHNNQDETSFHSYQANLFARGKGN